MEYKEKSVKSVGFQKMLYICMAKSARNDHLCTKETWRKRMKPKANGVKDIDIHIITRSEELPELDGSNFFHSPLLFRMAEQTPGQTPYMVVACQKNGTPLAHLLAMLRRRGSWIPPYLFTQGRVYGEGVYADEEHKEELFALMLSAITTKLHRQLCLYIEFSDIGKKMFGYKSFRQNGYFSIGWMQIHNSLHSKSPELRIDEDVLEHIHHAYDNGAVTREARNEEEVMAVFRLLKRYYRFRFQRFIPDVSMFMQLHKSRHGSVNVTIYRGKVIGGSIVAYSEKNAYLWFEASKKKRYPLLRPHMLTVWHALKDSYDRQREHIFFMNVGLPFRKNLYREFILHFGGKPVSTFRWFHFTFHWLNRLLAWVYRE